MSTVQEIIDYAKRKYPRCANETDANFVSDLNDIQTEIYVSLSKLKNSFKTVSDTVVDGQLNYNLPSDCVIDNIISLSVSDDVTKTNYTPYTYIPLNSGISSDKTYYGKVTDTSYFLLQNGGPLSLSGRDIQIRYYPRPTPILVSDLTVIPDLDIDFHNLLKYKLVQEMASQGVNPDVNMANYYQAKFDEFMVKCEDRLAEKSLMAPDTIPQVKAWW